MKIIFAALAIISCSFAISGQEQTQVTEYYPAAKIVFALDQITEGTYPIDVDGYGKVVTRRLKHFIAGWEPGKKIITFDYFTYIDPEVDDINKSSYIGFSQTAKLYKDIV